MKSYLLDSNILIGFLNGDQKIADWMFTAKRENNFLFISFISSIEVLSLKELKDSDIEKIEKFLASFHEVGGSEEIIKLSSALRRKGLLTLGDAIIASTAISRHFTLVTNDKILKKKVGKFTEVVSV